jgi:hypothetical protein
MPPMPDHELTDPVPAEIVADGEAAALAGRLGAEEIVDAVPVLAEMRVIESSSPVTLPVVQAAAAAVTGFVAGAATLALIRRHSVRKLSRSRMPRRAIDALPIIGSRSFLVDVHLIAKGPEGN